MHHELGKTVAVVLTTWPSPTLTLTPSVIAVFRSGGFTNS